MHLPLIPAPRHWTPSAGQNHAPQVSEELVDQLSFIPQALPDEAYEIQVSSERVELRALAPLGLLRARATWNQWQRAAVIPCGLIQDEPALAWRGLMLDCCRHFFPVADLKALFDRMAALKLNRFHWHLTDDQGWRLAIPGYPRLTEVGAWRTEADGQRYGGWYSAADVTELVAYGQERGIVIVPEIELPGHCMAALAAYPELSCDGQPRSVPTTWGVFDGLYCTSSPAVPPFLRAVFDEVCRLFPGPWIHIGGDEVRKNAWQTCPRCQQKLMPGDDASLSRLEAEFFRTIITDLEARGKTVVGWNELAEHALSPALLVQWWHRPDLAQRALRQGNHLISSSIDFCYFDYPYTRDDPWIQPFMDPIPVEKVYQNPILPAGCAAERALLQGSEACVWTEQVPPDQLEARLEGRLEAFAEISWCFENRPGWESFVERGKAFPLGRY